jgi:hypothetical protein
MIAPPNDKEKEHPAMKEPDAPSEATLIATPSTDVWTCGVNGSITITTTSVTAETVPGCRTSFGPSPNIPAFLTVRIRALPRVGILYERYSRVPYSPTLAVLSRHYALGFSLIYEYMGRVLKHSSRIFRYTISRLFVCTYGNEYSDTSKIDHCFQCIPVKKKEVVASHAN